MKRRSFLVTIAAMSAFFLPNLGQAFSQEIKQRSKSKRLYNPPPPPPTPPFSGTQRGTGSRGKCNRVGKLALTAFVPKIGDSGDQFWGQTTAEYPTLWFYLPYANPDNIEFVLQSSDYKDIERRKAYLSGTPGVVGIKVAQPLEVGKPYFWFFQVKCDDPPDAVSGWIQRVSLAPAIAKQIASEKPEQQAVSYAKNGVWYDALTAVGRARRKDQQNATLKQLWNELLTEIDLQDVAAEPIVW